MDNIKPDSWSPLVAIQSGGANRPFFCVHGLGGHILLFKKLAHYLGPDQPFFAFQARGIEPGQEPLTRIEDMAEYYIDALRKIQPDGPYLLGGYSLGGTVAFEMAQQLRSQGQKVAMLAIIDMPAQNPRLIHLQKFASQLGILFRMSSEEQLEFFFRLRRYMFRVRSFGRLRSADKIAYWQARLNGRESRLFMSRSRPNETHPAYSTHMNEDMEMNSNVFVNHRIQIICDLNGRAYQAYIPQRYQGDIVLIRSAGTYATNLDKNNSLDPYIGWRRVISGIIDVYVVPGDHNEIIREPHVRQLAQHLRTCLQNAQQQFNGSRAN